MSGGLKFAIWLFICICAHSNVITAYLWWGYMFAFWLNRIPTGSSDSAPSGKRHRGYTVSSYEDDEWKSHIGPDTKWVGNTGYDINGKFR